MAEGEEAPEVVTDREKAVREAFQRFDTDGSGTISREELGQVLKQLNPDDWDQPAIDQLLADADASGDGQLQIEEFVKWAFAQDSSISGGRGFVTMVVEGSQREELNGVYVPQEETYFQRPVFYCAENDRVLFYHGKRKAWQIFWQTATWASARLKTVRGPHMPQEAETWGIYDGEKKSFLKDPGMKCRLVTPEEQVSMAPENVELRREQLKKCWFLGSHGLGDYTVKSNFFKKSEELFNDRPVYKNWTGTRFSSWVMWYDATQKTWKMTLQVGKDHCKVVPMRSVPTNAMAPHLTPWERTGSSGIYRCVIPNEIDAEAGKVTLNGGKQTKYKPVEGVPEGWKDPEFPHDETSMGPKLTYFKVEWVRIGTVTATPVLFENLEPANISQGMMGDCWLLAALAAVAEFPSFFKDHVFVTQELPEDGKIEVKLFDCKEKEFKVVTIDDYLPMRKWNGSKYMAAFADIMDHCVTFALLEKAFAKFFGSFAACISGSPLTAWAHLTGCTDVLRHTTHRDGPLQWVVTAESGIICRADASRRSPRVGLLAEGATFEEVERICSWIKFKKIDGKGPDEGFLFYYEKGQKVAKRTSELSLWVFERKIIDNPRDEDVEKSSETISSTQIDAEEYWTRLKGYDEANYLMGTQCTHDNDERQTGIMPKHSYSVLKAVEVEGIRLVQSRNPWGHMEWNGPWSDRCDEWAANPSIAEALGVDLQYEGSFWMEFEDFLYIMGEVEVCKISMPVKRSDFNIPMVEEDEEPAWDM